MRSVSPNVCVHPRHREGVPAVSFVEVTVLEARNETIEATLDGELIVRAMRVDTESGYVESFGPSDPRSLNEHWMIYLPGAHSIVRHEIPVLHYFGESVNPI